MSDHLDFVRIRNLQDSDTEVFQGLGASGLPTSGGGSGTGGTGTATDWGNLPTELMTQVAQYFTDQVAWVNEMETLEDQAATTDRGIRNRDVPAVIKNAPIIPVLLATLATGGASLPVVIGEILIQIGLSVADAQLRKLFERLDPDSDANRLKRIMEALEKGLLYKPDPSGTDTAGVLPKALIYTPDATKPAEQASVLNDRLSDLALVDATITAGDDLKIHVKGKALEF